MTKFRKPKTFNYLPTEQTLFSEDISGLYEAYTPVENIIENSGIVLRYKEMNSVQFALITNYVIFGLGKVLYSDDYIQGVNQVEILNEIIKSFDQYEAQELQQRFITSFHTKAAIEYLYPAIEQCFPDIKVAYITDIAFWAIVNFVLTKYFAVVTENIQDVVEEKKQELQLNE